MAGTPRKEQQTESFQMTVPVTVHRYLTLLARNTMWGPTIQDVILKMITPQLHTMFSDGTHEKKVPEI